MIIINRRKFGEKTRWAKILWIIYHIKSKIKTKIVKEGEKKLKREKGNSNIKNER